MLRESDGGLAKGLKGRRGPSASRASHLLNLLEECQVHLLRVKERRLKLLVPPLQTLDLQALALTRRLSGTAVTEDALNSPLFLLIFSLGAFPFGQVSMWQRPVSGSEIAYLGGRFVLGSGRTWPHDLRFLTGFFSGSGVVVVEAGGGVKVV